MHAHGVLCRLDVTVAQHGNVQRTRHGGDLLPACVATVHLRSRARMEREHAHSGVLTAECDGDRISHLLVPATADLAGHRQRCGGGDGANDLLYEVEITQASRATV